MKKTPEEMDQVISTLGLVWAKAPELRFCQLVQNIATWERSTVAASQVNDIFYIEDEVFEKNLQAVHGRGWEQITIPAPATVPQIIRTDDYISVWQEGANITLSKSSSHSMREHYGLLAKDPVYLITRLYCKTRGDGIASRLMDSVTELADKNNITIVKILNPEVLDSAIEWYRKWNFIVHLAMQTANVSVLFRDNRSIA
jgi:hypothetical protein